MGNVFSRAMPLKESLMRLEEQIRKEERRIKDLKAGLDSLCSRVLMGSCVVVAGSIVYSYVDEQSMLLIGSGSALVCYVARRILVYLYGMRIRGLEAALEILKERQKEQIDLLKKEESFETTKKLIDKYEGESMKRQYFGGLRQRKRGMMDSVTDMVLGDDPGTMYALICRKCSYHNGLVHPSEYGLNEFYCYNCSELNIRTKAGNNNK